MAKLERVANAFLAPISERIWRDKYQLVDDHGPHDATPSDTFGRVARAAASVEPNDVAALWEKRFKATLSDYRFLPAGRILAGADSSRGVTLFNCFVMGLVPDSLDGIFDTLKQSSLTLQSGGGIGLDFSTLRPKGALVQSIGAEASGPVSFMDVWDAMCRTIMSAGARRGAMMATLRADHPDIEEFIAAKSVAGRLTNFNLSVLVPDALMTAVEQDAGWPLVFEGTTYRTVRARDLWDQIMRATYQTSEPGVIFIDRINGQNNLSYCEDIFTTNPCGEQPLPPFGACLLGSFNLARYVASPFEHNAQLNLTELKRDVHGAVRMLDNLIDVSHYPLESQRSEAQSKRRMGLGVTGLANALIFLGKRYDTADARATARGWMSFIQSEAYAASAALAAEKGAFPLFDEDAILAAPNVQRLPKNVRDAIRADGLRNGCLTSIAPTGTISLLAGNVSSGIEPVFDLAYTRKVLNADGTSDTIEIEDYAYASYKATFGTDDERDQAAGETLNAKTLPEYFVTATGLSPQAHLDMQNALQPYVDSSISKTINCPADASFEDIKTVYSTAYAMGLKGCTTYRPTPLRGAVLSSAPVDIEPDASSLRPVQSPASVADHPVDGPTSGAHGGESTVGALTPVADPTASEPMRSSRRGDVVYMAHPLSRERALNGVTYKLKWPESDHAIYVTLNDIETDGRRRPFEIFINTRNLEHFAWTVALTRMISAVFRRGGDVSFVADELQAVFDPQGGRWIKGRYVPSLLAAIGDIIDEHLTSIGFYRQTAASSASLDAESQSHGVNIGSRVDQAGHATQSAEHPSGADAFAGPSRSARSSFEGADVAWTQAPSPDHQVAEFSDPASVSASVGFGPRGRGCPKCGRPGLERREGCWVCDDCGFSKCD